VLVGGEAGIGKTSPVERFAEQHRRDARILWGGCEALFTPRPLGPLYDIAHHLQSDVLALLDGNAPRARLFAAVLSELQPAARPTVVVLEDLHWADEATLDLVKFLGRRIHRSGALLILTYRDDEVGPRHPLRLVLGDLSGGSVTRILLSPLSEAAVETLARRADRPVEGVYAATGGNPFFVTEVLASDTRGVPATVRDAVVARATRLSPAARCTLDVAAVIGTRVESWVLEAVARTDAQATEEAVTFGLLRHHGDGFQFRHELTRQAILEELSPSASNVIHKAVFEALRSSRVGQDSIARLAHHAEAAGDTQGVLEFAPAAARRAVALGAHREAAAQYARALRFAQDLDPLSRAALLEGFALEARLTDRLAESIEARNVAGEIYRAAGDRLKEGENLAYVASSLVQVGRNVEAEHASQQSIEVLEALPPSAELANAYRMQSALRMLNRDTAEAVAWGEKAISLAAELGAQYVVVGAYNTIGSALLVAGDDRGRGHLETSLEMARAAGLDVQMATAYVNLGSALGEQYRFREADEYLAAGIAYCHDHDLDQSRLYMLAWRALVHLYRGRWNEAAEDASTVLRRPGASAISRIMALVALGRLRSRRGDPEVGAALDEALDLATQTGTLQRVAPVRAARAEAAWLAGDANAVRTEALAAFDLAMRHEHSWFVGELAFWRWRVGDLPTLPNFVAEPFRLQIEGKWAAAAEAWAQLGCPYEQARALADGDADAGKQAVTMFEQLGARPASEVARRTLRARGIRGLPRGPREPQNAIRAACRPGSWKSWRFWPLDCRMPRSPRVSYFPRRPSITTCPPS